MDVQGLFRFGCGGGCRRRARCRGRARGWGIGGRSRLCWSRCEDLDAIRFSGCWRRLWRLGRRLSMCSCRRGRRRGRGRLWHGCRRRRRSGNWVRLLGLFGWCGRHWRWRGGGDRGCIDRTETNRIGWTMSCARDTTAYGNWFYGPLPCVGPEGTLAARVSSGRRIASGRLCTR